MDYLKKSLNKLNIKKDYEEIDSRLASGWYVDSIGSKKVKKYKTSKVAFKIFQISNKYLYFFCMKN